MRQRVVTLGVVLMLFAGARGVQAEIVFSDGDFSPGDWYYKSWTRNGTVTLVRDAVSGNPGACVNITTDDIGWGGTNWAAVEVCRNDVFTWNPATDGEILTVQMAIDTKRFHDGAQYLNVIVEQGGKYYGAPLSPMSTGESNWHTLTLGPYSVSHFNNWAGPADEDWRPFDHPDFSPTGSALRFGFAAGCPYHGLSMRSHFYDNWSVSLDVVPEPSAALLLATGVGGILAYAWPRRKRAT